MKIELTEQQARAVAEAARTGLTLARDLVKTSQGPVSRMNPNDEAAAYVAVDKLDRAWQQSTGFTPHDEPCCDEGSPHPAGSVLLGGPHWVASE